MFLARPRVTQLGKPIAISEMWTSLTQTRVSTPRWNLRKVPCFAILQVTSAGDATTGHVSRQISKVALSPGILEMGSATNPDHDPGLAYDLADKDLVPTPSDRKLDLLQ